MLSSTTSDMASLVAERAIPPPPPKATRCRKMYLAAFAALLFAVAMGMAGAYSATATADMQKSSSRVIPTDEEVSWIGSLVALGAFFGGIIAGPLSDNIGRKITLMATSFPLLAGWLLIAYASNVRMILTGRFTTGFCTGILCCITPMYLVEISRPENRGFLGASSQVFTAFGMLCIGILGSSLTWNWQAVASAVLAVMALGALAPMPESPVWLIAHGKYQTAIDALRFLEGPSFDAVAECESVKAIIAQQPKGKITCKEILEPTFYKPAFICVSLLLFQQLCGSTAVLFYTEAIFEEAKSPLSASNSTILANTVLVLGTAISCTVMDKFGRKLLLLISGAGMAVCLIALGGYDYAKFVYPTSATQYSWIALASIIVYIATLSFGLGPVPWLMVAEMSPIRYKGLISAVAAAFCWAFVFAVAKTFVSLEHSLHEYGTYWLYAAFCVLSCIFTVFCVPETKGKSFEEIEAFFCPHVSEHKLELVQQAH